LLATYFDNQDEALTDNLTPSTPQVQPSRRSRIGGVRYSLQADACKPLGLTPIGSGEDLPARDGGHAKIAGANFSPASHGLS